MEGQKFKKYFKKFKQLFGGIAYKNVEVAPCMQGRLHGYLDLYHTENPKQGGRFRKERQLVRNALVTYLYWYRLISDRRLTKYTKNIKKESKKGVKGKVVFIIEGPSRGASAKTLRRVYERMPSDKYVAVSDGYRYKDLKDENLLDVNHVTLDQFCDQVDVRDVKRIYKQFSNRIPQKGALRGVSFRVWLKKHVTEILFYITCFKNILNKEPRGIVNSKEGFPQARVASMIAKDKDISSFFVQHGLTTEKGFHSEYPITSETIYVYGQRAKEWYVDKGVNEEKIVVSGSPRYDSLTNVSKDSWKKIKKRYNINETSVKITLATQPWNQTITQKQISYCVEAIKKSSVNIDLLVKPHPRNDESVLKKLTGVKFINLISKDADIGPLLKYSNVVVTYNSTVGLESMAFGTPVVVTNFVDIEGEPKYCKENAALCAKNLRELCEIIERLTSAKRNYEVQNIVENSNQFVKYMLGDKNNSASFIKDSILKLSQ